MTENWAYILGCYGNGNCLVYEKKGVIFRFNQNLNRLDIKDEVISFFKAAILSEFPPTEMHITENPEYEPDVSVEIICYNEHLLEQFLRYYTHQAFWCTPRGITAQSKKIILTYMAGLAHTVRRVDSISPNKVTFSNIGYVFFWDIVKLLNSIDYAYNVEILDIENYSICVNFDQ